MVKADTLPALSEGDVSSVALLFADPKLPELADFTSSPPGPKVRPQPLRETDNSW